MNTHWVTLVVICNLSFACATAKETPVSHCDALVSQQLQSVYASVDKRTAEAIRMDIEGSRYTWADEPTYTRVRELVNSFGAREYIRLEVGRSPGRSYDSVWYVSDGATAVEFATGEGGNGLSQRTVPVDQWAEIKARATTAFRQGIPSIVSTSISDSPVYFYCAHLDGKDVSFVLEEFPERIPQFVVVRDTLRLSKLKTVPRELNIFVGEGERANDGAPADHVP